MEVLVLSLVLGVEVLVLSSMCSLKLTMETTVLPSRHRLLVGFPVGSVEVLMFSPVLGIEVLVLSPVLSVQALVLSPVLLILVMSKDNRGRPQQYSKGKNGQSSFL